MSTAVSIKALLQTIGSVLSYLRDVKDGQNDCKKLIIELTSTRGILDTLLDTFQDMEDPRDWSLTIKQLGERQGPLALLPETLEDLLIKLSKSASASRYEKFTRSLLWPFALDEMEKVLKSIESDKSFLLLALENDQIRLLTEVISRRIATISGEVVDSTLPPHLPAEGPQSYARQDDPIDELSSQFSQTHITTTTATTVLRPADPTSFEDGVQKVIRNVLMQDLTAARANQMIYPDHPCFRKSRAYARRWRISAQAVDNHIKLACGNPRFPVLMLLNPSPEHDTLSFDAMVRHCRTLKWIKGVLREIGLTLDDIIILDICPLLSDRDMASMDYDEKDEAMDEAFDLTKKMLQIIRPNIILSCQCSTTGEKWGFGNHEIAEKLCSSITRARGGEVIETDIEGHVIQVVQAYHPGGFLRYPETHHDPSGESLKELLSRIYHPCSVSTNGRRFRGR
jgi:hypothetical protein